MTAFLGLPGAEQDRLEQTTTDLCQPIGRLLQHTNAVRYLRPTSWDRRRREPSGVVAVEGNEKKAMNKNRYPPGWSEERVRRVLEHYDEQSDQEAVAEDEAAFEPPDHTAPDQPAIEVPVDLVPAVRDLLAQHEKDA